MKLHSKSLIKELKTILVLFTVVLSGLVIDQTKETGRYINDEVHTLLASSIKEFIKREVNNEYQLAYYKYDSSIAKLGEYVTETFITADTTFTYQSKVVDFETYIFREDQTALLFMKRLRPQPINHLFDSLLQTKNIHNIQTSIGIDASFYPTFNEWSKDTANLSVSYRTDYLGQGNFEDINYHAYVDCSWLTYWKLMPKSSVFILLTSIIICSCGLFFILYKKKQKSKEAIACIEEGVYRLKETVINLKERTAYTTEENEGETIKLSPQQARLLSLFLDDSAHKVSKELIKKEFWPNHADATTNMTTAIKRLKEVLIKINSAYTITSDPENEEFYILSTAGSPKHTTGQPLFTSVASILPLSSSTHIP